MRALDLDGCREDLQDVTDLAIMLLEEQAGLRLEIRLPCPDQAETRNPQNQRPGGDPDRSTSGPSVMAKISFPNEQ